MKGASQVTMKTSWRQQNQWIVRNLPECLWSRSLRDLLMKYQKAREELAAKMGVPVPEFFFTLPGEKMDVKNVNHRVGTWLREVMTYLKRNHPGHFEQVELTKILDGATHWVRKGTCSGMFEAGDALDSNWTTIKLWVAWVESSNVAETSYLKVHKWLNRKLELKYAEFFFSAHFHRNRSPYQETYPGMDDLNIGNADGGGGGGGGDPDDPDDPANGADKLKHFAILSMMISIYIPIFVCYEVNFLINRLKSHK